MNAFDPDQLEREASGGYWHQAPAGDEDSLADRYQVPHLADLVPDSTEIAAASLRPTVIVEDYLFADVAQMVAPGSTGKTTALIHESACIALGWPVWGLATRQAGWTLFITSEDRREHLIARLREICGALELGQAERDLVFSRVLFWDVTGLAVKLVAVSNGNIVLTPIADAVVERYRHHPPVVVTFDPLVSFGASEQAVNDNEQALITAARRIVRGLGCCVRYVHHTGKANARAATLDQYSGRGGSAMADGSRMTTVLQTWKPGEESGLRPPPECRPDPRSSITVLARAKLSYSPPNLPLIWIKRTGFAFEHFTELQRSAEEIADAKADQVERYLISQHNQGRYWTKRQLEDADLGMSRRELRAAITALEVAGRVVPGTLPAALRQGSRQTYLRPINCAEISETPGAVPSEEA